MTTNIQLIGYYIFDIDARIESDVRSPESIARLLTQRKHADMGIEIIRFAVSSIFLTSGECVALSGRKFTTLS